MFSIILFDLDGTLTDSGEGITNSVAYALERFGFPVPERECLYPFIGPPLRDSFMKYYGMDIAQADAATAAYREYFSSKGWQENIVYDGIEELLSKLHRAGKRLIVATSKAEFFATRILEHFGLVQYFDLICGAPMQTPHGHGKADVIADALNRAGITDLCDVVMVGDRLHDVVGAHKVGIPAIGVLYGYGDKAEHENCGADYIMENVSQLQALLLREHK